MKRIKLPILCTMLWLCVIWGHSLQPAAVSSQESGAVLAALSQLLEMLHLPLFLTEFVVRKAAHMTEYLILALLLAWTWSRRGLRGIARWAVVGALSLSCAFLDETIQLFVAGRTGKVADIWVDLAGAAIGLLVWQLLEWIAQKSVQTKRTDA